MDLSRGLLEWLPAPRRDQEIRARLSQPLCDRTPQSGSGPCDERRLAGQ